MIRRFSFVRKRPELSSEEFLARWTGEHVELAKRLPGLRRYVIHVIDDPAAPYDGIAITSFDSRMDAERAFADPPSRRGWPGHATSSPRRSRSISQRST